jgi:uncharacterized protein (TIRG00374 family)
LGEENNLAVNVEETKQKRNRILSWLINLSGVLVFGLILYQGGIETWQQIAQSDWRYLLAAFVVTLLWNLVAAYRWSLIANRLSGREICSFRYFFTYHMIGMLMGQVVPITVGMLGGRPAALSLSQEVSLKRSALSVFLDKLFDLTLAVLLVVPVALYLVDWISRSAAFAIIGIIIAGSILLMAWQYARGLRLVGQIGASLSKPLGRVPVLGPRLAGRLPQQIGRLATETLLPNRVAVLAYSLTLVMYTLLGARLFFFAQALRLEIPWYLTFMGVAIAQLALVFAITPGSLGFLEGGWWAVFSLAGMSAEQFLTFVIGRRAFALVFTLIDTLLAFAWIRESPAQLFRAVLSASRRQEKKPQPAGEL